MFESTLFSALIGAAFLIICAYVGWKLADFSEGKVIHQIIIVFILLTLWLYIDLEDYVEDKALHDAKHITIVKECKEQCND